MMVAQFAPGISVRNFCRGRVAMKKVILLIMTAVLSTVAASAQTAATQPVGWPPAPDHQTISVWPGAAPGAPTDLGPEADTTTAKDNLIAGRSVVRLGNVARPTLTLFRPKGKANGAAVVVFPGGGYRILAIDLEGTEVCDWLNSFGVTCALLKYRVPGTGPYPKSSAALQDAQRAMSLVRQHAAEWGIDPNRVGTLGFSAGGHLSAAMANLHEHRLYEPVDEADKLSCRPDFSVVIYPGYLALADQNYAPNPEIKPGPQTPPSFVLQAEDDPVHMENAMVYYQQLKNAKVPAELHIYADGGHGYGLRATGDSAAVWPRDVERWLRTIRMVPAE
jgi:acetyl esterase/lipase